MKNITIVMDEDVAAWLRVEAAKAGKSVSRYIGDTIAEKRGRSASQLQALEQFLAGPPMELTDETGKAPSRGRLNGRASLR